MGVAIGSLIGECKQKIDLSKYPSKRFGFDAYNTLFQFVTTIRGIDSQPLRNNNGEITSHLNGLFYRMTSILSYGIRPAFVFDGISHELKQKTKEERRNKRLTAEKNYKKAVDEGDLDGMNKYSRQSATIDKKIIDESKELLLAMGIPVIDAPGEAEAQVAWMTKEGTFDCCVSQDYDCLLFGSPNLLKNIAVSGKKKVPFKKIYVDVEPTKIELDCVLQKLEINYEQLLWLSVLIGTDFNDKVEGVGPVTALKLVKENKSFEDIEKQLKEKGKEINFDYDEVANIFRKPDIKENAKMPDVSFNREKVENILIEKADFDEGRVKSHLDGFLAKKEEKDKQKTLDRWF